METATPETCLDCGAALHGPYCSRCGQRHGKHDLRLLHVVEEMIHDLSHFDGRLLRTLRLVFLRPGQITLEYLAGRRTRYVPPFRLYIFISFVLFLLLGFSGSRSASPVVVKGGGGAVVHLGSGEAKPEAAQAGDGKIHLEGIPHARQLERGLQWAKEDPHAFREELLHWLSRVMFLLLPAFAALLLLAFLRSRRFFVEHVIFSLHFHAFAFTTFILQWLLELVPWGPARTASGLLVLALPVHLGLSMKRVYGGPTWKILLKGALVTAAYLILVSVALLAVLAWVLDRRGAHA
ncbi:MAG TPA: DUF3667 domain-containing protein [Holophaga sp.]|nr:DUF3667 domain-containing protein [Holophaga sp.]